MPDYNQPGTVVLINALAGAPSYLFRDPVEILTASTSDQIDHLLRALDEATARGLYAAGYMAYEAGYALEPALHPLLSADGITLAWFGLYRHRETFTYEHTTMPVVIGDASLAMTGDVFAKKIDRIKYHIERGETYQVNLTTKLRWVDHGNAEALLHHILAVQPVEFGAWVHTGPMQILSASPELFFRREGNHIITRPMKGTAQRGRNLQEDREQMQWLANDEKNRAENLMIVDLLRNDLGRICATGSVRVDKLFAVERYPTLHQMTSTVRGELNANIGYNDIFRALFPSGSIVGAPKIKTMELIRALEEDSRGVYTGSIGYLSPDKEACFSVAIRTITLERESATLGVGAGITYDSDATSEYEETRLKGSFLHQDAHPFQLIETLLWDGLCMHYAAEHLARLQASADYFDFRWDQATVERALFSWTADLQGTHRIRLLLNRDGSCTISSTPITLESRPLRVLLSKKRTDSRNIYLHHKTTRRALYDEQLAMARSRGFDEVLFCNERGHITEGCITNFFVARNGQLITPPLADGVLSGVLRTHLKPKEQSMRLEDLLPDDRLYLGNSVRGLISIEYLER